MLHSGGITLNEPVTSTSASDRIIEASKRGDVATLRAIERSCNGRLALNFRSRQDGSTALYLAASNGHLTTCDWLIRHGADVLYLTAKSGSIPLHGAAERGHCHCVVLLIRSCPRSVNHVTKTNGDTPLHLAAYQGYYDVIRLLLAYGASGDVTNQQGRTPLDEASIKNHYDVYQLLCSHRLDAAKASQHHTSELYHSSSESSARNSTSSKNEKERKMITAPIIPSSHSSLSLFDPSSSASCFPFPSSSTTDSKHNSRFAGLSCLSTDVIPLSCWQNIVSEKPKFESIEIFPPKSVSHTSYPIESVQARYNEVCDNLTSTEPLHAVCPDRFPSADLVIPSRCSSCPTSVSSDSLNCSAQLAHIPDGRRCRICSDTYCQLPEVESCLVELKLRQSEKDTRIEKLEKENVFLLQKMMEFEALTKELAASRDLAAMYLERNMKAERELKASSQASRPVFCGTTASRTRCAEESEDSDLHINKLLGQTIS